MCVHREPYFMTFPLFIDESRSFATSARSVVLVIGLCLLSGCSPPPPNPASLAKEIPNFGKLFCEEKPPSPVTTDDVVVYLDGSKSMGGYVIEKNPSVYQLTLRKLVGVTRGSMKVNFRKIGTGEPGQPEAWEVMRLHPDDSTYYDQGNTNLVAALDQFPINLAKQKDGPPSKVHILITDGVQSQAGTLESHFSNRLVRLLKDGWLVTVFGIRSQFRGKIYSEYKPSINVQHEVVGSDLTKGRPFYVFVCSLDSTAHHEIVKSLREELAGLRKRPESQDEIRELPLSDCFTAGHASIQVQPPPQPPPPGSGDRPKYRPVTLPQSPAYYNIFVNQESSGPITLKVSPVWSESALHLGSVAEKVNLIEWSVDPVWPEKPLREKCYVKFKGTHPTITVSEKDLLMTLQPEWPRVGGNQAWRVYRITGRINPEKQLPQWIEDWSTNDDTQLENAGKTYSLKELLKVPWQQSFAKDQPVAEFYLSIGPK